MNKMYRYMALTCLSVMVSTSAFAYDMQTHADALVAKYPQDVITSAQIADQAIADANQVSAFIDARQIELERACYDKFFTNSCLYDVGEEYRQSSKKVRNVTVIATRFKRQLRADQDAAKTQPQPQPKVQSKVSQ